LDGFLNRNPPTISARQAYKRKNQTAKVVWFNAWRQDKDEALWAAFALTLTQTLAKQLPFLQRIMCHLRLRFIRFDWRDGWFSAVRVVILSLVIAFVTIAFGTFLYRHPDSINPASTRLGQPSATDKALPGKSEPAPTKEEQPENALIKILITGAGSAGYRFLMAMLLKKVIDVLGNPFKIDLRKSSGELGYDAKISFIERFHEDFAKILRIYSKNQTVFVFIDDMDRCELPIAANLMQGINLLLSDQCNVIYVLGIDRDKIAAGLAAKYEKLLTYLSDQGNGSAARQTGLDFGYDFLEKFIQIPYQILRPSDDNIVKILSDDGSLKSPAVAPPSTVNIDPGILFETDVDSALVKEIAKMASPALNHNPRRLKQFVNCFRIGAITASRTGLFGPPRSSEFSQFTPEQLGKLVTICLRWPSLLEVQSRHRAFCDLLRKRRLVNISNIALLLRKDPRRWKLIGALSRDCRHYCLMV
jgi:hypothetical protein